MAQTKLRETRLIELSLLVDYYNKSIENIYEQTDKIEREIEHINKCGFYIPLEGFKSTNLKMSKSKSKGKSGSNAKNDKNIKKVTPTKSGKRKGK